MLENTLFRFGFAIHLRLTLTLFFYRLRYCGRLFGLTHYNYFKNKMWYTQKVLQLLRTGYEHNYVTQLLTCSASCPHEIFMKKTSSFAILTFGQVKVRNHAIFISCLCVLAYHFLHSFGLEDIPARSWCEDQGTPLRASPRKLLFSNFDLLNIINCQQFSLNIWFWHLRHGYYKVVLTHVRGVDGERGGGRRGRGQSRGGGGLGTPCEYDCLILKYLYVQLHESV